MRDLSLIVAAALAVTLGACERHSWEGKGDENGNGKIDLNEKGTKELYEEHHAEGGGHDKGHAKEGGDEKHPAGEDKTHP